MKTDHKLFADEIRMRGIDCLVHFTPTINLLSMYQEGYIYSRAKIEELDIDQTDILDIVEFTDKIRYDDKSYINLSIQTPNHFLFSRFQERTSDKPHICWCVIKIDPKYIYHTGTLFSVTNAASYCAKTTYGISDEFDKFKMLFKDNLRITSSSITRVLTRNGLKLKYPTDVQAEVLVKDAIDMKDVLCVCFRTKEDLASTKAAIGFADTSRFIVEPQLFTNARL